MGKHLCKSRDYRFRTKLRILVTQSSWNSSIEAAAYLNNKLVSEASYRLAVEIPKGDPVPQFDQ
ncbi:MAG: hypothetical protein ACREBQ_12145, partial [Nitrososphaerales archaeon]